MSFSRRRSDEDFAAEVEAHLALETDRLIAEGVAPRDAAAQARRAFGNVTVTRERFFLRGPRRLLEQVRQDLRYAGRSLRRSPGFAFIAIACLAVGISVNTAAFSVLNALLFRDFPGVVAQRDLVTILLSVKQRWGWSTPGFASLPDWEEFQSGLPAFSGIGAVGFAKVSVRTTREPEAVRADFVSPGFFAMLGTRPAMGRFFSPDDASGDDEHAVVLGYGFWERELARRADVLGMSVTIGTHPFTVIGVAPTGFVGLYPGEVLDADVGAPELFLPLSAAHLVRPGPAESNTAAMLSDNGVRIVGRLRGGASVEQASAEASVVAARLTSRFAHERQGTRAVVRAGGGTTTKSGETLIGVLFAMAVPVIILLVACANLANQLLTRAVQRSREIAVRLSLGATPSRIVRQLLVEAAAIAVLAGVAGMLLARWILDALRAFFLALPFRIPFDGRVLLFTAGVAVVTAVLFGLVPALRATRMDLAASLKAHTPGGSYRRSRLQSALVVVQIAASLALIAMSGVFMRAARPSAPVVSENGSSSVAIIALDLDLLGLTALAGKAYQDALLERMSSVPGVSAAAIATFPPFGQPNEQPMRDVTSGDDRREYEDVATVSGDWFGVHDERPIAGRLLTQAELAGPPVIGVVDAVFAKNWWGDSTAIGRSLRIGEGSRARIVTIVGVIDTIRDVSFRQPEGRLFIPATGSFSARTYLYVRTTGAAAPLIETLRETVRSIDTRMPILWARTLDDVIARDIAPLTLLASGLKALGVVALALAALGLFGVMSFVVAQRSREIGIRVALGARRHDVTWMVLRHALQLGAVGVFAGAATATATAIVFRSLIHGLPAVDPATITVAATVMFAVAIVASLVPARRAAGVDPNVVLRDE